MRRRDEEPKDGTWSAEDKLKALDEQKLKECAGSLAHPAAAEELWECDGCGFRFHKDHTNADGSGYSCPVCAIARLESDYADVVQKLAEAQRARDEWETPAVNRYRKRAERAEADNASLREQVKGLEQIGLPLLHLLDSLIEQRKLGPTDDGIRGLRNGLSKALAAASDTEDGR